MHQLRQHRLLLLDRGRVPWAVQLIWTDDHDCLQFCNETLFNFFDGTNLKYAISPGGAQENLRLVTFLGLKAVDIERRRFGMARGCMRLNWTSSSAHIITAITTFMTFVTVSNGLSKSFRLNGDSTDRVTLSKDNIFNNCFYIILDIELKHKNIININYFPILSQFCISDKIYVNCNWL